jgi:formate C-acetyltransferase
MTVVDIFKDQEGRYAYFECSGHADDSAVEGEDGLKVLRGVLQTYMDRGGASIHFNIFSSDVLRKAQAEPEKYRNLQVRVCGWNARFVDLDTLLQEEFIKQATNGL